MYERYPYPDELYHYGVKGQKWGVRRYQPYRSSGKIGNYVGKKKYAKRMLDYTYRRSLDSLWGDYKSGKINKALYRSSALSLLTNKRLAKKDIKNNNLVLSKEDYVKNTPKSFRVVKALNYIAIPPAIGESILYKSATKANSSKYVKEQVNKMKSMSIEDAKKKLKKKYS